ncbi:MAG: HIT family protein [Hyphomicrobium aestuarii]|nr:HIT family protein [Hyphomicrobium aestuarii]
MTYDTSNIFAKILRREIPCHAVYEDDLAIVFMDVMPQSKGHVLVVPKAASRNVLDADPAVLSALMPLVQTVAQCAKRAFQADGISIMQFNEPAGGQTVFHLHVHVIPRYEGEGLRAHTGKMEDPAVLAAHAAALKAVMGSA